MGTIPVVAAVVVGVALVVAGGSKLAAGGAWPEQARGMGAPSWAVPIVPWIELVVGAALVTQLARRAAAVAAIVLLVAFSALIARLLRRGEHPPCACFGSWSLGPIGPRHLVRNAALLALAIVALA